MGLCETSNPVKFTDACVRSAWGTLLPAILVACFCAGYTLAPATRRVPLLQALKEPWRTYLPLREAKALDGREASGTERLYAQSAPPLWRTVVLVALGLAETLFWLAIGCFYVVVPVTGAWNTVRPFLVAGVWLYTVLRPIVSPPVSPPFDLFTLYAIELIAGTLELGGLLFDHTVFGYPLPGAPALVGMSLNLVVILVLLGVVLEMPLATPDSEEEKAEIGKSVSPEDYTTLLQWLTFSWVYPLVRSGRDRTLNDTDVWGLSPTVQSRPIFLRFMSIRRSTLLRRLWAANSLDLLLDALLSIVSVLFNYCGPLFFKLILVCIENVERHETNRVDRSKAYVYAFVWYACALAKAESDLQHLWFGRRAATRIRSELMAAIYDKALKRKDLSGIVGEKEKASAPDEKMQKGQKGDQNDPKAGADIGKIVNLMAGDANRISNTVSGMYMIYGAPFEILIAAVFLYQLLGWSAFVGFVVVLAGWPLNNFLATRSVQINKGTMGARDKRMAVLNELIGAVKFIKFFAWEGRWIDRAMDARKVELKWMVKARFNSVMFYALWTTAPILVSIISFAVYVLRGNVLSVSTAFTAIALFQMIRAPLNVIPAWIVQMLQAKVAMDRIEVYLNEEEVDGQVSTLKRELDETRDQELDGAEDEEGLGLENATLKWNEVKEPLNLDGKGKETVVVHPPSPPSPESTTDDSNTVVDGGDPEHEEELDHHFELRDITVRFPERELTLITGPTASGKTAMLMALLGEMTLTRGRLIMSKKPTKVDEYGLTQSISYAAQTPWLRHQSIKDNILFGYPYDEERYKAVLECCALKPDLAMLEDGDATEIGARGVSLSGGQKARVALARAVYARTRYVLLDDPLSAVDSHTSRFLFEKLLLGPLMAHRTVILVTHHVELVLPGAHYLIRMLDGRIDTHGTLKELRAQGVLEDIAHDAAVEVMKEEAELAVQAKTEDPSPDNNEDTAKAVEGAPAHTPRKLVKEEHRETGNVKWQVYKKYLKASSYWTWTILVTLVIASQLMTIVEKVWIMTWGEAGVQPVASEYQAFFFTSSSAEHEMVMHNYGHTNHLFSGSAFQVRTVQWPNAIEHPLFYVGIYAAIGAVNILISLSAITAQYTGALRASKVLFKQLLVTVVRATFRFHDTTPQGRMLNRFGKDIETIDSSLAGSLQSVNTSLASFAASVLTVAFVFPIFLVPATLIGAVYRELAISYLNTGRDLRRMESNTRSPIFSDFGELLEGIVTVRAFSAERRFLDNLHKRIDATTKMWYGFWMTNRWLLLNFDALGATGVLITSLFSIANIDRGPGLAGLCITSALSFTSSVYWACRFWTGLELDLNSVERVVEYLELPQEPPAIIASNRPPAYWPSSSNNDSLIVAEKLEVRYAPELPPVLQDVSFDLKAGERVGLLGRTGSGKSTLAMSLLRFVDPAKGRILIDGIDISTIGVQDLRSRLTFIPQDATLFSGTLRDNLDPFNEHTDSECIDVLARVQMLNPPSQAASRRTSRSASAVSSPATSRPPSIHGTVLAPNPMSSSASAELSITGTESDARTTVSLDTKVSAGGTNFSQGQRQLIAMARALLRRSSIIVLDEATSSIDFATDATIQRTIREEFTDSLLVTVAHRLRTVIDYDRLIVLDKGKISEFDTPWRLLQKEDGIFRNMCLKSGTYGELEAAAKAKAERDGLL